MRLSATLIDSLIGRSKANSLFFGVFLNCYPFHDPKVESILLINKKKSRKYFT